MFEEPSLLMPFDTDHPEYSRGFELGQLWAALERRPDEHKCTMRDSNTTMIVRTANYFKYHVQIVAVGYGWVDVTLSKDHTLSVTADVENTIYAN